MVNCPVTVVKLVVAADTQAARATRAAMIEKRIFDDLWKANVEFGVIELILMG